MGVYYYYEKALLHVCGRAGACSARDYRRLTEKGKITKERLATLSLLKQYGLLSLSMAAFLLGMDKKVLYADLEALSEYGLVIKQFYECQCDGEALRTEGFYCAAPIQPMLQTREGEFVWNRGLRIADAMSILSFNQFHIALISHIPKKAIYAKLGIHIRGVQINGSYQLKGRRYRLGYSHMMAVSVRDFAEHNKRVVDDVHKVWEYFAYREERTPWFILICENKLQCASISRKIGARVDMSEIRVFFVLDTDMDFRENPLMVLQKYRFAGEGGEIVSEAYGIEEWF